MSELLHDLDSLQEAARNEIAQTNALVDLEQIRVRLFGKKGEITAKLKALGTLDPETRRSAGARSEDDSAIEKGVEVVISRYEKGIAYVRRWDEFTGEKP